MIYRIIYLWLSLGLVGAIPESIFINKKYREFYEWQKIGALILLSLLGPVNFAAGFSIFVQLCLGYFKENK
ncbi:MAG: hypothetical protein KGJ90_00370 [Patescibacteria group bacterium]|nr:hypothetical protein [Patescibacteria group bacterium]